MRRIVIACALLGGCATPAPQIITKTVYVPVAVACVDPKAIPAEPAAVALPLNDARLAADIAASQALAYHAWGRELLALIQPCTIDRNSK
jgi:uncharacterized lipoprotein YajG